MASSGAWILGCCVCCSLLIIWSSLLGVSFDTLEPTEIGLRYDGNVMRIDMDKTWGPGRYLVGLGRSLINFPTAYETLRFGGSFDPNLNWFWGGSIQTRSSDGLRMILDVSFSYQVSRNVEDLIRLYQNWAGGHANQFQRNLKQVLADVSSDFSAVQFFTDREAMQDQMAAQLNATLVPQYAQVVSLELVAIDFYDTSYEEAITTKQVALQDVLQAYAEQAVAATQASTKVAVAQQTAVTLLQTANQTALSYIAAVTADAEILLNRIDQQATALLALRAKLGLNTSQELLAYNYYTALTESQVLDVVFNSPFPAALAAGPWRLGSS